MSAIYPVELFYVRRDVRNKVRDKHARATAERVAVKSRSTGVSHYSSVQAALATVQQLYGRFNGDAA